MDFTDLLDSANTVTSNGAALLRGFIDAAAAGEATVVENLRPLAQQLDDLFGDTDNPVPDAPAGGVPTDSPVTSDADAAAAAGVVTA